MKQYWPHVVVGVLVAAIVGVIGYFVGANSGAPADDVAWARQAAMGESKDQTFKSEFDASLQRGNQVGTQQGQSAGAEAGALAARSATAANQERNAQERDLRTFTTTTTTAPPTSTTTTAKPKSCNEPYFPEGYCPSPE